MAQGLTIDVAKSWYIEHRPSILTLKSGDVNRKSKEARPDWSSAFSSKNDKFEVVEVSLLANVGFAYASQESYSEWEKSRNTKFIESLPRMVIVKDRKTKKMESFLMTIVGDKNYLERKSFSLRQNSYLHHDKDFSGQILFHNLSGKFVNGWKYSEGKVTHTIKLNECSDLPVQLKNGILSCTTIYYYSIDFWVTSYYTVGGGVETFTGFGNFNMQVSLYTATQCDYIEDENLTGGGLYLPPVECYPRVGAIQNQNSLDSTQLELLENAIAELQQLDCLPASMYNRLVNLGAKINFAIGTQNSNPAQYDSSTKTLSFFDNSAITASNILEELFHALQDAHYSGGISQYANVGYSNVEFEAKLFCDVVNTGCCSLIQNTPDSIKISYFTLIDNIRLSHFSTFSIQTYNDWVNTFRQYCPSIYAKPTSSDFSDTELLNTLLSNCNN